MHSKTKIAIICAVLICVAGVLWMATTSQRSLEHRPAQALLDDAIQFRAIGYARTTR